MQFEDTPHLCVDPFKGKHGMVYIPFLFCLAVTYISTIIITLRYGEILLYNLIVAREIELCDKHWLKYAHKRKYDFSCEELVFCGICEYGTAVIHDIRVQISDMISFDTCKISI